MSCFDHNLTNTLKHNSAIHADDSEMATEKHGFKLTMISQHTSHQTKIIKNISNN